MKVKFPHYKLADIISFILLWAVGIGLIALLMILLQSQISYDISWPDAFRLSIIPGFVWAIIGTIGSNRDSKIAAAKQSISDAVIDYVQNKK